MDILGDTISYSAAGGAFTPLKVEANYRDADRVFDHAEVAAQDVKLSALKVDVPNRPSSAARLTLPKIPGKTFRPINVRTSESGTEWEFEIEEVPSA